MRSKFHMQRQHKVNQWSASWHDSKFLWRCVSSLIVLVMVINIPGTSLGQFIKSPLCDCKVKVNTVDLLPFIHRLTFHLSLILTQYLTH